MAVCHQMIGIDSNHVFIPRRVCIVQVSKNLQVSEKSKEGEARRCTFKKKQCWFSIDMVFTSPLQMDVTNLK